MTARLTLPGHFRFASTVTTLGSRLPQSAGISWRERGVDGWEVSLHGVDERLSVSRRHILKFWIFTFEKEKCFRK